MKKIIIAVVTAMALFLLLVIYVNFSIYYVVDKAFMNDPDYYSSPFSVYCQRYILVNTLVYDIRDFKSGSNLDLHKNFLYTAELLKDYNFKTVWLAFRGARKLKVKGMVFKKLGRDYAEARANFARTKPGTMMDIADEFEKNLSNYDDTPAGITGSKDLFEKWIGRR